MDRHGDQRADARFVAYAAELSPVLGHADRVRRVRDYCAEPCAKGLRWRLVITKGWYEDAITQMADHRERPDGLTGLGGATPDRRCCDQISPNGAFKGLYLGNARVPDRLCCQPEIVMEFQEVHGNGWPRPVAQGADDDCIGTARPQLCRLRSPCCQGSYPWVWSAQTSMGRRSRADAAPLPT
jgi:hypothetical protein